MNTTHRNYALDFLKFIAAIFITNSHFIPVYKDVNVGLATLGVHGNALFFFVSGYLLLSGLEKHEMRFANWFKRRVQRLWPAVFLWALIASIVWNDTLDWQKIIIAPKYWFLQCIVVFYALYFFVCKFILKSGGVSIGVAILFSIVSALFLPKSNGSLFHTSWHYVCHFSVMILGGLAYLHKDAIRKKHFGWDFVCLIISFVAYFGIMSIGKGQTDWRYYTQIVALLPLHTFCWFAYKVCAYDWCSRVFTAKNWRWPFIVVSNLTLEIYIVQFHIITDRFNSLFPFSWFIVFAFVCAAAYFLRVCVNVFIQFMGKEDWKWKTIVQL